MQVHKIGLDLIIFFSLLHIGSIIQLFTYRLLHVFCVVHVHEDAQINYLKWFIAMYTSILRRGQLQATELHFNCLWHLAVKLWSEN